MSAPEFEQWSSPYGEVKDLVDKIKMFSNLRIQAYESGLRGNSSFRQESDDLLWQIEKDLDSLVHDHKNGGDV